ncbi:MAG: SPFH domain-containing protein [Anaerolineales bacterium]
MSAIISLLSGLLCVFVFAILVAGLVIVLFVNRKVPENENWVVTRSGQTTVKGPGRVRQIPLVDQVTKVDMREISIKIQDQSCVTKDLAPVLIYMIVTSRVVDPLKYASRAQPPSADFTRLASSTLKDSVGTRLLNQILSARDELGSAVCDQLNGRLDPALGLRIERVEIVEIYVSKEVLARTTPQANAPSECPACGAPVNAPVGKNPTKCEYCGFSFKV